MSTPATVDAIVARIEAIHTQFAAVLARIDDDRLHEVRLPGGRSGKDLLAHLTFWDRRLLHAVAPPDGPQAFRLAPPLIADIPRNEHWVDSVNERIFELNRHRELAPIKREFVVTCAELRRTVGGLTEHDVFDPDGLSALLGEPFLPMVLGAYGHYKDHLADLELLAAA